MKKTFIFQFIAGILFLFQTLSFSQGYSKLYEQTVKSPNAAEFSKYGEIPVSKYTGVPNISIPLYEMNFDGLKIPISLSYHAGGIRAAQEATWVGLGWSLSASGVITRSINQVSDLGAGKGPQWNKFGYAFEAEIPETFTNNYKTYIEGNHPFSNMNVQIDTQADIFTVNLFGRTIKFYLKQKQANNGTIGVQLLEHSNDIVTYNESNNSFTIVDSNGFIYNLDVKEHSSSFNYGFSGNGHLIDWINNSAFVNFDQYNYNTQTDVNIVTSWYVSQITSPKGRVLDFNFYDNKIYVNKSQLSFNDRSTRLACQKSQKATWSSGGTYSSSYSVSENQYQKEIINLSSGEKVKFYLSNREDVQPITSSNTAIQLFPLNSTDSPKKLDKIEILDLNNKLISHYDFEYDYFNNHKLQASNKYNYLRLKLDRLIINNLKTYDFSYIQPNDLPQKNDLSVDFWGFFNGANNVTNRPTLIFDESTIFCDGYTLSDPTSTELNRVLTGGNRGADFEYGKIGLLQSIKYPTKGTTEFVYESNEALVHKNNEKWTYNHLSSNHLNVETETIAIGPGGTKTFTPSNDLILDFSNNSTSNLLTAGCYSNCGGEYLLGYSFRIKDSNNTQVFKYGYDFLSSECGTGPYEQLGRCNKKYNGSIFLSAGETYTFVADDPFANNSSYVNFTFRIKIPVAQQGISDQYNFKVGGARIKTLINKDHTGDVLTVKDYSYVDATTYDPVILSKGKLMNPVYNVNFSFPSGQITNLLEGFYPSNSTTTDYLTVSVNSNSSLGIENATQGSHIGYTYVDEIFRSNDITSQATNGKIRTRFINEPNTFISNSFNNSFVEASPYTYTLKNGKTISELYLDKNNTEKRFTEYFYDDFELNSDNFFKIHFLNIFVFTASGSNAFSGWLNTAVAYYPYNLILKSHVLTQKKDSQYLNGQTIVTIENYEYNDYFQNKTVRSIGSDKKQHSTYIKYPKDLTNSSDAEDLLIALNQVDVPIEVKTEVKSESGTVLTNSTQYTVFNDWSNNIVLPNEILTLKGFPTVTNTLEPRVTFHSYDNKGNPTEVSKKDGTHIVYIWGYNQTQPIVKIENATYGEVELAATRIANTTYNSISKIQNLSNLDTDLASETYLKTALNDLRDSLPNAQVTTYTYDPLIGVTSVTDPRGETVYYHYDNFNRLEFVKDAQGNILSKNQYNYKN